MVARDLEEQTTYTFRIYAYDEIDENLFGFSDFSTTKTYCSGTGDVCSGFVNCPACLGTKTCKHGSNQLYNAGLGWSTKYDQVSMTCPTCYESIGKIHYGESFLCNYCNSEAFFYSPVSVYGCSSCYNKNIFHVSGAYSNVRKGYKDMASLPKINKRVSSKADQRTEVLRVTYPSVTCVYNGCSNGKVPCNHTPSRC